MGFFNNLKRQINPLALDEESDPQSAIASQGWQTLGQAAKPVVAQALDVDTNLHNYDNMVGAAVHGDEASRQALADKSLGMAMGSLKPLELASAEANAPTFYSKLQQLLEEKMGPTATAQQVEGVASGAKPDEVKYLGLKEYLQGKDKVNKEDLLAHLKSNEPKIQDVVKGGTNPKDQSDWSLLRNKELNGIDLTPEEQVRMEEIRDVGEKPQTKFSQYTLPGGENYKETLHTLPSKKNPLNQAIEDVKNSGDADTWTKLVEQRRNSPDAHLEPEAFSSSHYDEPNILAHTRTNDRIDTEGKKNLFVEELQSDWHQAGRKSGYKTDEESKQIDNQMSELKKIFNPDNEPPLLAHLNYNSPEAKAAQQKWVELEAKKDTLGESGVPDAPFKKTWQELGLKKLLREAAEKGYDKLAWTTGEQQAERYDLSKQVDNIQAKKRPDGTYYILGDKHGQTLLEKDNIPEHQLSELVGKDLAEKIASGKGTPSVGEPDLLNYSGADLKVGGEGMKGFYDKIIPDYLNKFAKKFGTKVGESEIPTSNVQQYNIEPSEDSPGLYNVTDEAGEMISDHLPLDEANAELASLQKSNETTKVHSLEITPEMRKEILTKGFPLFMAPVVAKVSQRNKEKEKYSGLKGKLGK